MTELLPWLILMLLLIMTGIMHSTDVDKLMTAGATLIMIGGLYFLTAMVSEPVEPTYSGVDILLIIPALIKWTEYAFLQSAVSVSGIFALLGAVLVAAGCIRNRLRRKNSPGSQLASVKINEAEIHDMMHHSTEDAPEAHVD